METLFRFFSIFKTLFVFIILQFIALSLYFTHNEYQHGKYLNTSNKIAGNVYSLQNQLESYLNLGEVNWQLTRENSRLRTQLMRMEKEVQYLSSDTTLAKRKALAIKKNYELIPATIVEHTVSKTHNYLTLDAGSEDGVEVEMGVIGPNGIVGMVSAVSKHFALVVPILNTSARFSVKVKDKSETGTLVWKGDGIRQANLEEIPAYIPVAKGDSIITSGLSTVFPEGILAGRISDFGKAADQSMTINVELATDFSKLEFVDIIAFRNREELTELQQKKGGAE